MRQSASFVWMCLFLSVLGICPLSAYGDEIIIGTGTSTWVYPLSTYYHDARTQTIYLQSELGDSYTITGLALYVAQVPGQTMNSFTVRMKHTDLSVYGGSPNWESADWTIVYQTNQSIATTGWVQFDFAAPFEYNGVQNLMVDISFNDTFFTSDGYCRYSSPGGTRSIYYRTDSGYGDPLAWSGTTPPPSATTNVPNLKLIVEYLNKVAAPAFSPGGGTYNSEQEVVITCSTPGATIRYTTNAVDPNESDPIIESGSSVPVNYSLTLKAKAWKDGLDPSSVRTADYNLVVATPVFAPAGGTYYVEQNVVITCSTPGAIIYYTTNGLDPNESDPNVTSGSSIPVNSTLTLKAKALKGELQASGVKSATYQIVVATPSFSYSGGTYYWEPNVAVTCSTPGATIHYTTNGLDPNEGDPVIVSGEKVFVDHSMTLKARAWKGQMQPSSVRSATYQLLVTTPVFSPDGGVYASDQNVIVTCSTPGATIHYTTNGLDPNEGDPVIASGSSVLVGVDPPTTLKARGWKTGFNTSAVAQAFYRVPLIIHVTTSGNDSNDGLTWPTAKLTVHGAIDIAGSGDNIWVAAGTYAGGITLKDGVALYGGFAGDETELSQRDCNVNETILDGGGSVVTVSSGASETTRIDGFTIRNGYAPFGGGIYIYNASPIISNNVITENTARGEGSADMGHGGGIYLNGSGSPVITDNLITNNRAEGSHYEDCHEECHEECWEIEPGVWECHWICDWICVPFDSPGNGGGIFISTGGSPIIANNTINANSAEGSAGWGGGSGGGLYLVGDAIVTGCTFGDNSAGYGGGIHTANSSPEISNNVITANRTNDEGGSGGGIYIWWSGSPIISNNMIMANSAHIYGGGIYYYGYSGSPTIVNNTIAANDAVVGGGIYAVSPSDASSFAVISNNIVAFCTTGIYRNSYGTVTLSGNCVFGNANYNYFGVPDPTGTIGNISQDPNFANADYGDFHVQPDSPCVNTGINDNVNGQYDIDGQPRIQPAYGQVDIGADESDGTIWPAGPPVIVRVSPGGNDVNDGSSWELPKRTVQAAIDAASDHGGDVWVKAGTYQERITVPSFVYLYGGFAANETQRSQRDWLSQVAILDGNAAGSVVTFNGTGYMLGAIDGFTIRNGDAFAGGGIYCAASVTIANNIITANTSFSQDGGGGICCLYCSPVIVNNTISENVVDSYYGGSGGGISCSNAFFTIIKNNLITRNTAGYSQYCHGGGIDLGGASSATVANNIIAGNRAGDCGGAIKFPGSIGGSWPSSGTPLITNNVIAGNKSRGTDYYSGGGGIYSVGSFATDSPRIVNNTITANSAASGKGGGIYCADYGPTIIANTVVAFNSSGIYNTRVSPPFSYNCVYGNTAYDYNGFTNPTGTNGNISQDPLFVWNPDPGLDGVWGTNDDDYGNLNLLPGSPCIDAGDNNSVPKDAPDLDDDGDVNEAVPFDLAGNTRFHDDPCTPDTGSGTPPIVNIGAYEWHPCPYSDLNGDCWIDFADFALFAPAWLNTPCVDPDWCAGLDLDQSGAIDWADLRLLIDDWLK